MLFLLEFFCIIHMDCFQMQSLMWKFWFSSSVWNLIMKCILKMWIYCLFNKAWILMKSSELLWLSVIQMFIYLYIIIIVSYRFYCLLWNDLTVEIYLLHDIWIIKDKIFTYSCYLLLQVPFYCNVFFIDSPLIEVHNMKNKVMKSRSIQ